MALDIWSVVVTSVNPLDGTQNIRVDLSPDLLALDRSVPDFEFYRNGKLIKTFKFMGSNDPDFLRDAERDDFFAMAGAEFRAQATLGKQKLSQLKAANTGAKELAKLKTKLAKKSIDELQPAQTEEASTANSQQPTANSQQPTRNKHMLVASRFIAQHVNLPLQNITRKRGSCG
jgi:hypothetical protein